VQTAGADGKARKEADNIEDRVDRRGKITIGKRGIIEDDRNDAADDGEKAPSTNTPTGWRGLRMSRNSEMRR